MPRREETPSALLRAQLRGHIRERIADLGLSQREAGEAMALNKSQVSRLMADADEFSFDRLADAAARIRLVVRVTATRPWGMG